MSYAMLAAIGAALMLFFPQLKPLISVALTYLQKLLDNKPDPTPAPANGTDPVVAWLAKHPVLNQLLDGGKAVDSGAAVLTTGGVAVVNTDKYKDTLRLLVNDLLAAGKLDKATEVIKLLDAAK